MLKLNYSCMDWVASEYCYDSIKTNVQNTSWIPMTQLESLKVQVSREHSILLWDLHPSPHDSLQEDKGKTGSLIHVMFPLIESHQAGGWSDFKVNLLPFFLRLWGNLNHQLQVV